MQVNITHPEFGDVTVEVTATYRPGDPGNLNGPPECCWPSEPAEVEVEKLVIVDCCDEDGNPVRIGEELDFDTLPTKEQGRIEEAITEKAEDDAEEDYDEEGCDDRDFDY